MGSFPRFFTVRPDLLRSSAPPPFSPQTAGATDRSREPAPFPPYCPARPERLRSSAPAPVSPHSAPKWALFVDNTSAPRCRARYGFVPSLFAYRPDLLSSSAPQLLSS